MTTTSSELRLINILPLRLLIIDVGREICTYIDQDAVEVTTLFALEICKVYAKQPKNSLTHYFISINLGAILSKSVAFGRGVRVSAQPSPPTGTILFPNKTAASGYFRLPMMLQLLLLARQLLNGDSTTRV